MQTRTTDNNSSDLEIAIIGAGFSGLCMAINLKKAGIDAFKIFEKADRLGGTWRDNTYPGAACDVPSLLYSFSFAQKYNWKQKFAEQPEILQYMEDCAQKYDIKQHIQFNTEITTAAFDRQLGIWNIHTQADERLQANILISGSGQLNRPKIPDIPGLRTFSGVRFHSARWNHQHDLGGKVVAVIGNGASAIQFIPEIAERAKQLFVFQRSPHWIVPKLGRRFTRYEHWLFKTFPLLVNLYRCWIYLFLESRFAIYYQDSPIGKLLTYLIGFYRRQQIQQATLRSVVEPDFPLGCKRILLSDDYYQTLQRPNVELISSHIKAIDGHSIVTLDGREYPVDSLIFATGFQTTSFLAPMKIVGLNGQLLAEVWRDGAEAYKGIMVSGFPNLFLLYGPNTNLGHNSIIFMIESQVHYIMACLKMMRQQQLKSLDVRPSVQSRFNQKLQARMAKTVWSDRCNSWYKTAKGKIVNNWPRSTLSYWFSTRRANLKDFTVRL